MKIHSVHLFVLVMLFSACSGSGARKKPLQKGDSWVVNDAGDSLFYRYSDQGVLLSFTPFKNGMKHGLAKKFYSDGKVQYEINYQDGFKHGVTRWFFENGNLYKETRYKHGLRDGIVKKYYRDGKLKAEEPYEKGVVVAGLKEYTKSGKLKKIYPSIQIQPIDHLSFSSRYILRCSLTENKKSVKFFRIHRVGDQVLKEEMPTVDGVADFEYTVPRGQYLMKKEIIRAEYKTVLSNIYVIEKEYNLALDN